MTEAAPEQASLTQHLLKAREVAEILRVDVRTVGRWALLKDFPYVLLPSGRRLYRQSDVDAILRGEDVPFEEVQIDS